MSLDDEAERDLRRMQAAREAKVVPIDGGKRKRASGGQGAGKGGGKLAADAGEGGRFELVEAGGSLRPGVYWHDGSDRPPVWVCSPMRVEAETRNLRGGGWGRLLSFADRDGRPHRVPVAMTLVQGSGEDLRAQLAEQGLDIATDKSGRQRLLHYITAQEGIRKAVTVSRTGWHRGVFVMPGGQVLGDPGAEEVVLDAPAGGDAVEIATAGTLDSWREAVSVPVIGNARPVLALSAAFAGPCLELLGMEGGGLHFRFDSSAGKTTLLELAASVYGPPGYRRTWRATDNALESIALLHSDMLLPLDELGQLDPKAAGAAAYLLANGMGKGRQKAGGGLRDVAKFRVLFLSSGELSLGQLIEEGGGRVRAGQEVRVVDVPADAGGGMGVFDCVPEGMMPGAFANRLKAAVAKHYGHAILSFLREVTSDRALADGALRSARDAFIAAAVPANAHAQVHRVAHRFAAIAAAGELATAYGITGWPEGEAHRAALACMKAWLGARGGTGDGEGLAILGQVRHFLSVHGEARFSRWTEKEHAPRTLNRAGFVEDGDDGPTYYVEPEPFKRELCKGFDVRRVVSVLRAAGALRLDAGDKSTRMERLPDGRRTRVYVLTPALWGDE